MEHLHDFVPALLGKRCRVCGLSPEELGLPGLAIVPRLRETVRGQASLVTTIRSQVSSRGRQRGT